MVIPHYQGAKYGLKIDLDREDMPNKQPQGKRT